MKSTLNITEEELRSYIKIAHHSHNINPNSKNKIDLLYMFGRMSIFQQNWEEAIKWFGQANSILIECSMKEELELYYWTGLAYFKMGEVNITRLIVQRILTSNQNISQDLSIETLKLETLLK